MKKIFFILCALCLPLYLMAGVTTYTFTSTKWASKVGATVCDGTTDGWKSDKDGSAYDAGRTYTDGTLHDAGVSVQTGASGAGATSVLSFEDVRKITINFCQNASKGIGAIYVQVGDNEPDSIMVYRPAQSGTGDLNRDSVISYTTPQTGHIKFWVKCTQNAIHINTISIRSAAGGSSVFTMDTYQLVTDVAQLEDSDQVIFGVPEDCGNYIMGYFDEDVSVNNIHAIKGRYSADRSQVDADDRAIYTLRKTTLNGNPAYIFQDEIRYEEAYLVASGGQTKNRLALWTSVYDEGTYGNYGYWSIAFEGSVAVVTNLGNSKGRIIQYNASNNPTLFACYESRSQKDICLYRRVEAMGDVPAIVAPLVNFGTTIETTGARTITVNANRLNADISASLKYGEVFSIPSALLDRDGEDLTISFDAPEAGHYVDTLILRSGEVETRVAVLLNRINPMTVSEAVTQEDYTQVYLKPVVVTKKYDKYVYVRDETGSMLLFDRGDGETGKRYAADTKAGDVLSGVTGRTLNYFGVPELSLTAAFKTDSHGTVEPEQAPDVIDSADVCRYLKLAPVVINDYTSLTYKGRTYAYEDKFNLGNLTKNTETAITCIVSYDRDVVTLYIVSQEAYNPQGIDDVTSGATQGRLIIRDGIVLVETEKGLFTVKGERLE